MSFEGVNLLPWRAMQRAQTARLRAFGSLIMLLAGLFAGGVGTLGIDHLTQHQIEQNQHLESAIARLNERILDIDSLQDTRAQLAERMATLKTLADDREQTLERFTDIASALPDALVLQRWSMEGSRLDLTGISQGLTPVAALMSRLETLPRFGEATLVSITSHVDDPTRLKVFHIQAETPP